ncbi:MAG TPA: hypothetical protein VHD90_03860 [Phototrophicaceae bacterium]|nr:hypothetical protein [Phototrophicaceae bacterium]
MPSLSIGYVLEGARRGYNFTSPTDGIAPDALKAIWRGAMPRGQGWEQYPGAVTLKCFALDSGEAAICDVTLTDLADEVGRKGIRQAAIKILPPPDYRRDLLNRLYALPAEIVAHAERKLYSREWQLLFKKYRDSKKPKSIVKPQTILAYPYNAEGWRFVEACILLLATRSTLLTNLIEMSPAVNPFADKLLSFTTLALDYREEGRIVALPLDKMRSFPDVPFVNIS